MRCRMSIYALNVNRRMDFTPIVQLRLRRAFDDNEKFKAVSCDEDLLNELFECGCRGRLYVYDDSVAGHSVFLHDTAGIGSEKVLCVKNPGGRETFLWHIDGVLFAKDSKCDCALLTTANVHFVEFKSNAANKTPKAIEDNYEKASRQLQLTFEEVRDRCRRAGIKITEVVCVDAYAVFNRSVPRNNALKKNLSAKFLNATGVKLHFSDEMTV